VTPMKRGDVRIASRTSTSIRFGAARQSGTSRNAFPASCSRPPATGRRSRASVSQGQRRPRLAVKLFADALPAVGGRAVVVVIIVPRSGSAEAGA